MRHLGNRQFYVFYEKCTYHMYIPEAWCKLFHWGTPRLIIYYAYNYYNIPRVTVNDMSTESVTLQKKPFKYVQ